jgi:hypothetical protein
MYNKYYKHIIVYVYCRLFNVHTLVITEEERKAVDNIVKIGNIVVRCVCRSPSYKIVNGHKKCIFRPCELFQARTNPQIIFKLE